VRNQLADAHVGLAGRGELRPVPHNRRIELEVAALEEEQKAGRDHALGTGEQDLQRVGGPRPPAGAVGDPAPQIDKQLTVTDDSEGRAELAAFAEVALELPGHQPEPRRNVPVYLHDAIHPPNLRVIDTIALGEPAMGCPGLGCRGGCLLLSLIRGMRPRCRWPFHAFSRC
jgi:hypothetical protein